MAVNRYYRGKFRIHVQASLIPDPDHYPFKEGNQSTWTENIFTEEPISEAELQFRVLLSLWFLYGGFA